MQHNEEDLPSPTMKRKPLLAMMGLLPERKSGRMKTSVILIAFLLVCMVFLGFRYWTVHQLSDRYQRRISFLERTIYINARDEDDADRREKDFQRELKKQNTIMNSEVAKLSSRWQLERESLMQTVDSKNAAIKRNGEMFAQLKKDYEHLQQYMASFQVNQSQLLEKFTAQSVRVEMLIKLKDTCYAQMRSIGRHVSVSAREGPGVLVPAKDHPEVGTPARESPKRVQLKLRQPSRESAKVQTPARESLEEGVPARESPGKGVSSRESPAGGVQTRESAMVEEPARESPDRVQLKTPQPSRQSAMVEPPARERLKEEEPIRESPRASTKAGQSVNEKADQATEAAPAPAMVPSNSSVPVLPPQLGKEQKEKGNIEVQKQKKVASDASVMKDNKDILPHMKKDDKVSAGGSVNAPDSQTLPDSQPKKKQNNEEMEEEVPHYLT